ncbi:DHA1 family bicyclomycin/chloramphenicol resistance-like MFS transporter [Mucilaginibacter yixingensis]|uniref:DHA1 family bicyclomycin/chloramphenicol resistance-like MFS transporter n=1 Tax=Mucilaginibacter yixingensis TaxID=1295612 RepID=A0A2T5JAC1_9SPHI|nr:multidrug effflux MFS transporter [Mucilaginibacter yixingensis]PTQ97007.1 DHA1 family bicyclomycin/chloramphenicol resistance-like MFS transporter [Mucilaginibacter yixingensis]
MTKGRYFFLVLILGLLTALSPFSIDMYLSGFPDIAKSLHTTLEKVGLSLSGYFIGLAFGQLLYGPLLDKFGRKLPLYAGLGVYILASVACFFVNDIDHFIVYRVIQALGGCAASVAAMAMVRDIFPLDENAKVFALLMLVLGTSPMLAPTIGGYITVAFGWNTIFLLLGAIAVVIFALVAFFLPDGYKPDKHLSLKPVPILTGFWNVLKVPQFYTFAFAGAVSFAGLFTYVAGAPMVFMKIYHLDARQFGWVFAGLSVGFVGSGQLNAIILKKYTSAQVVPIIFLVQLIGGVIFLIGAAGGWFNLPLVIAMIFVQLSCIGLSAPNTSALCIAPFEKNAGTAAALLGAIQLGIGSMVTTIMSWFHTVSTVPLAAVMTGAGFLACAIYFIGKRYIKHQVEAVSGAVVAH